MREVYDTMIDLIPSHQQLIETSGFIPCRLMFWVMSGISGFLLGLYCGRFICGPVVRTLGWFHSWFLAGLVCLCSSRLIVD